MDFVLGGMPARPRALTAEEFAKWMERKADVSDVNEALSHKVGS